MKGENTERLWKNSEDDMLKSAIMKYDRNHLPRISSLLLQKCSEALKLQKLQQARSLHQKDIVHTGRGDNEGGLSKNIKYVILKAAGMKGRKNQCPHIGCLPVRWSLKE